MNTFTFTGKTKKSLFWLMLTGAILIGLGALTFGTGNSGGHGEDHGPETHAQQEHTDHSTDDLQNEDGSHDVETTHVEDNAVDSLGEHTENVAEEHTEESLGEPTEANADDHDAQAAATHDTDDAHGDDHGSHDTPVTVKSIIMTNIWAMLQFFFWIAFTALFFLAAHTVGWAGWHIQVQKILLSFTALFPVTFILGIIIFVIGKEEIFMWTQPGIMDNDALLASKKAFLNLKVFGGLSFLWMVILSTLMYKWWSKLNAQDVTPDRKHFRSARNLAAITIVCLAVINAFGVWKWIMSTEPHWYSTLYAWYTAASACGAMLSFTFLIVLFLKEGGYLPNVNENHFHDLGKYLFAISVFWAYLWFSQYMLIWYGNIPEETIYFKNRMTDYPVLFYGAFFINFVLPFFVLLKRDTKRNIGVMIFACIMLIIGHWFDFFNMIVTPNVKHSGMGLIAVGSLLLFTGFAMFVVLTALTKVKSLDSREHPYYLESVKHHI